MTRENTLGFHRWRDIPETPHLRKGTMRRAAALEGLTMQRGEMAPDAAFDERTMHRHPEDQFIVVLEGRLRMRVGEEEEWLEPGGFAAIPGGRVPQRDGRGGPRGRHTSRFSPRGASTICRATWASRKTSSCASGSAG